MWLAGKFAIGWEMKIPIIGNRKRTKNPFPIFGTGNQRLSFSRMAGNRKSFYLNTDSIIHRIEEEKSLLHLLRYFWWDKGARNLLWSSWKPVSQALWWGQTFKSIYRVSWKKTRQNAVLFRMSSLSLIFVRSSRLQRWGKDSGSCTKASTVVLLQTTCLHFYQQVDTQ